MTIRPCHICNGFTDNKHWCLTTDTLDELNDSHYKIKQMELEAKKVKPELHVEYDRPNVNDAIREVIDREGWGVGIPKDAVITKATFTFEPHLR